MTAKQRYGVRKLNEHRWAVVDRSTNQDLETFPNLILATNYRWYLIRKAEQEAKVLAQNW